MMIREVKMIMIIMMVGLIVRVIVSTILMLVVIFIRMKMIGKSFLS